MNTFDLNDNTLFTALYLHLCFAKCLIIVVSNPIFVDSHRAEPFHELLKSHYCYNRLGKNALQVWNWSGMVKTIEFDDKAL